MCRPQMAKPRLFIQMRRKNYLRRVFLHPLNYRQNVNELMIGKAVQSLEEQANSTVARSERRKKTMTQSLIAGKARTRVAKNE